MSSKLASNTTRIETKKGRSKHWSRSRVPSSLPTQQGLKHLTNANLAGADLTGTGILVPSSLPTQQGLKLLMERMAVFTALDVPSSLPTQQGLKREEGSGRRRRDRRSKLASNTTRIETHLTQTTNVSLYSFQARFQHNKD